MPLISVCHAQAPEIDWQVVVCDAGHLNFLQPTADGGFIAAGDANAGFVCYKTEGGEGGDDYWLIKFDSTGDFQWDLTIGGSSTDELLTIKETTDGGYILVGSSSSGISGDKTEANWDITPPITKDLWVIKLDNTGAIVWQNTLGGTATDGYPDAYIEQLYGGGYIVGTNSTSPISGDKMEGNIGLYDYWIIKLNNSGNVVWQNTIGGTGDDKLSVIHQAPDGGFIVGGSSSSEASVDKSENTIGGTGESDYWILKLNNSGSIVWQNTIGGDLDDNLKSLELTTDGGYIIGGTSGSGISGDKTEEYLGPWWAYSTDYWVVKINGDGNIEWQNTIGGGSNDYMVNLQTTIDGGYIIGGYSQSDSGYDKTEDTAPNTHGWDGLDLWIVKIDSEGIVEWDQNLGGTGDDSGGFATQTSDGRYLIGGYAGWDDGLWDKTDPAEGWWLIKLNSAACVPTTEICNSIDDNCNGLIDDGIIENITIAAGGSTTFCKGGSVLLTAIEYSGETLQWKKNGENITGATSITYNVTKKGTYTCQTTSPCNFAISSGIFVDVLNNPTATITAGGATTFCEGGSVVLTANAGGGLSYQWYRGLTPLAGATSINYTAVLPGNYKCRVTKIATGCFKNSNAITISIPCRESLSASAINDFIIYPNPANHKINLEIFNPEIYNSEFRIINVTGEIIETYTSISTISVIDINEYPVGIYLILLYYNEKTITHSFIKE